MIKCYILNLAQHWLYRVLFFTYFLFSDRLVKNLMKSLCDEDSSAERALSVLDALATEEQ